MVRRVGHIPRYCRISSAAKRGKKEKILIAADTGQWALNGQKHKTHTQTTWRGQTLAQRFVYGALEEFVRQCCQYACTIPRIFLTAASATMIHVDEGSLFERNLL